jgi:hypothetical protein
MEGVKEQIGNLTKLKEKVKKNRVKRSPRAKRIFEKSLTLIQKGKKPNFTQLMREEGYSEWSCRCQKVLRSDTWNEMLNQVPKEFTLNGFVELADTTNEDKRTRLGALKELATIQGLYPGKTLTINGNKRERYFEAEIIETEEAEG